MAVNETYSYKSWKRQQFTAEDPADFAGEIIGACFSQDEPFTDVFPATMTGVTFTKCNLDNCNIPAGNTVNGGTNKQLKTQNDGEIWLVDGTLAPTAPLEPERFDKYGFSKDPADIPITPTEESIVFTREKEIDEKINNISLDRARLEQILKDAGEL